VYYAPLPFFHIAGQWAVVDAAIQAGATVFLKGRFSVADFWADCRAGGATVSFLLGAMARFLHAQTPVPEDRDNPLDRILIVPLLRTG
jgi:crotonobetaine/carnitine-CoA ligase